MKKKCTVGIRKIHKSRVNLFSADICGFSFVISAPKKGFFTFSFQEVRRAHTFDNLPVAIICQNMLIILFRLNGSAFEICDCMN